VAVLIDRFISRAARSRLGPFIRLSQTIRKHRDGILAAIRLGITKPARSLCRPDLVTCACSSARLQARSGDPAEWP
jgi:hypothetical protein